MSLVYNKYCDVCQIGDFVSIIPFIFINWNSIDKLSLLPTIYLFIIYFY